VSSAHDAGRVRLQSCSEDVKLKTAELSRQQETVAGLQSQLSSQREHLRFVLLLVCKFYYVSYLLHQNCLDGRK